MMEGRAPVQNLTGINQGMGTHSLEALHKLEVSLVAQMQCRKPRFDPWVGMIPGEGNGSPLQYSCLENIRDRGDWWATVHGVAKSWTRLND